MKKYISRFHYITQDIPGRSHIHQVDIACQAGANWIQYRGLTKTGDDLIDELHQVAAICDDWGATLIITNHYHLLDKVDAQGVYMEDPDVDVAAIRQAISDEKTLGAAAFNIDQLLRLQNSGVVDYVAYGPFARTGSKADDHTLLGYSGYRDLQKYPVHIPVTAVGGIQLNDVEHLMQTGIAGIAVSSAINLATDPKAAVKEFYQKIY